MMDTNQIKMDLKWLPNEKDFYGFKIEVRNRFGNMDYESSLCFDVCGQQCYFAPSRFDKSGEISKYLRDALPEDVGGLIKKFYDQLPERDPVIVNDPVLVFMLDGIGIPCTLQYNASMKTKRSYFDSFKSKLRFCLLLPFFLCFSISKGH